MPARRRSAAHALPTAVAVVAAATLSLVQLGSTTSHPLSTATRFVGGGYSVQDVNGTKASAGIQVRTS